jgi:hypothetical protein
MAAKLNHTAHVVHTTHRTAPPGQGGGTLRRPRACTLLLYALTLAGCGGAVPPAEDTLRVWSNAVERGDCTAMYTLLASEIREQVAADTFDQWCVAQRDAMLAQSELISRSLAAGASPQVVARVPISPFQQVRVRLVDHKWLLDQPLPLLSGADDPLSAVAELARVLEGPQSDQFLSMMSPDLRASFLGRLHAVRSLLLAGDPVSLVVTADTASMVVGSITIGFRRHDGVWTIDDLSDSQYGVGYYE